MMFHGNMHVFYKMFPKHDYQCYYSISEHKSSLEIAVLSSKIPA